MSRLSLRIACLVVAALAAGTAVADDPGPESSIVDPVAVVGRPDGPPMSGPELDRRTNELAAIMRCPVCQALSVADSPTASALAMKEEVRDLLAAGFTEEQVLEYFEKSYGEFILLEPKRTGLNWLVWLAPFVFLAAGVAIIAMRRKDGGTVEAPKVAEDLSEYASRVRQEVGE